MDPPSSENTEYWLPASHLIHYHVSDWSRACILSFILLLKAPTELWDVFTAVLRRLKQRSGFGTIENKTPV